ncbi:MAG: cupin domain-containing protein [Edaphobacter sp.]|nr:cupin domain-containing protein [Edaphobacter sp.]MDE1175036.1 cupin domain-containing protein [Edaphobacter sp.]
MAIIASNDQKVSSGSASSFTGSVRVQRLFAVLSPSRTSGGLVTFQPGARTNWHTHPLGQVLIVTDSEGWVQEWGQPRRVIHKDDVIQIPASAKHWHGATASTTVTHISIQELSNGKNVDWLEPVTDSQYLSSK